MNQRERDALRNEHTKVTGFIGNKEIVPYCLGCGDYVDDDRQPYPCDVIKVLDAWEAAPKTNPDNVSQGEQVAECDHIKSNICLCDWGDECPMNSEPDFTYCPKCGEKLEEND